MESLETRISRLEYYQRLLIQLLDEERYRFYRLITTANLTEGEVEELLRLCESLSKELKKQKAEGLVIFSPLLTQFAGSLHPKLEVSETIDVLLNQGLFVPLLTVFKELLKKGEY
ncbi:DUF1878 family protein [Litchfieldia alkalitelluris]|uniref:DUF1878 family protein n=1 Tax=Litchfieldia alkalitelluris TaxID=304268 RepID=UPI0009969308|nr:DUF1878 family protein [Litchfieldia alkalitelluris]